MKIFEEEIHLGNQSALHSLDEIAVTKYHWKTVITAGMGFFTDAYDLFIIGTVTAILTPIWHLNTVQLSLLNSTALLAAVLGAIIFGRLMDKLGRKKMYGIEVLLLVVGAVLSAFSMNFTQLLIFRFIVGLGVGGDYPTSSVITAEYANRKDRGRLVTLVFAMQGIGLVIGPAIAAALLSTGLSHAIIWRLMLGIGAIPAASVIYLRRKIAESPRYSFHVQGDQAQTAQTIKLVTGESVDALSNAVTTKRHSIWQRTYLKRLIGTAGSWFLIDIVFYGNGVSSQLLMKNLLPHSSLIQTTLVSTLIFLIAALPGYYVAAAFMDRIGRKKIQWIGFSIMALMYGLISLAPSITKVPMLFLLVYAIGFFFVEFGPNTTTFLYPAELYPTDIRGIGHGLSASGGKLGAFVAAFLFPPLLKSIGLSHLMGILSIIAILGVGLTMLLPEPKQRALEELNEQLGEPSAMNSSHMQKSIS
ncbi:MFS transporter [Sulfoacidibacillus thermotolerans]|uniref:MFS transporter n=1 Tax=Sulfoacidibacillus thermotolerans TaxID=1765684 RepID=A0A2U3CZ88_SULT2|nr:MFS transporter [Sulfoacidibacillus thermotolerans]